MEHENLKSFQRELNSESSDIPESKDGRVSDSISSGEPLVSDKTLVRDVPISTLIHLLGLPTQQQVALVEAKIDSLASKITALATRLDRINKTVSVLPGEQYLDRIDYQIADLRTLIKKLAPRLSMDEESGSFMQIEEEIKPASQRIVLSSEVPTVEDVATPVEKSGSEQPLSAADKEMAEAEQEALEEAESGQGR